MITLDQLLLVSGAAVVFALMPGPAVIYVVTRSVHQDRRAGIMSCLGIGAGNLALVFATALGLSALLASSLIIYNVARFLGALYLFYLGIRTFLDRSELVGTEPVQPQSLLRVFRQGLMVGVSNPKAALFFLAFLPQFVDRAHGAVTSQIILLGTVVVLITLVSDTGYAVLADGIAQGLLRRPRLIRAQQLLAGCVYVGLGLAAAFTGTHALDGSTSARP